MREKKFSQQYKSNVPSRWAVWLLALLGITYQQLFHEKYKALETTFYVLIATLPSLAVLEMVRFYYVHVKSFLNLQLHIL